MPSKHRRSSKMYFTSLERGIPGAAVYSVLSERSDRSVKTALVCVAVTCTIRVRTSHIRMPPRSTALPCKGSVGTLAAAAVRLAVY